MDASPNGAAFRAGLKKYDIILAVDDKPIQGSFDLNKVLVPKKPGDSVNVKFWSRGQVQTKSVVLQEVESRD
jgi:serine protease Do